METQAEYKVSRSNMPMHAYVVMLHLVSQGYTDFVEIREVLSRESQGSYYITVLAHIVKKIGQLKEKWGNLYRQSQPLFSIVTEVRASGRVKRSPVMEMFSRQQSKLRNWLRLSLLMISGIRSWRHSESETGLRCYFHSGGINEHNL